MIKVYNKAVRDKIPAIIQTSGAKCQYKVLKDTECLVKLDEKLSEELNEYLETKDLNELIDLVEIIHRICELRSISLEEFNNLRLKKKEERGGFKQNIFLIKVENDAKVDVEGNLSVFT